ncbi:MAG: undecaprenyldiphospho-muramoylpentapeptide beta-N-acetylglucosaminyltransferase [Planctomycetota bacterium]|nr:MAG: undecaprenyldiphospho-muramoylpentapeptide beta-N-acetylglucosaminyltransferase [Planctomycetota bacterium]
MPTTTPPTHPKPILAMGTGGTGGHIFPAIALAEELQKHNIQTILLTTWGKKEQLWLQNTPVIIEKIQAPKWKKNWSFPIQLFLAWKSSLKILKKWKPFAFVGFGSYAAFPSSLAAYFLNIPLFQMEQNTIPGKVSRFFSSLSHATISPWKESQKYFHQPIQVLGNPIRKQAIAKNKKKAIQKLKLSTNKKTILVMGGSQGAKAINQGVRQALPYLQKQKDHIQWIHLCGPYEQEELKQAYQTHGFEYHLTPFCAEMGWLYGASDLFIGRSGGGSIAEASAAGLPMILIPYPYASNNHQWENAIAAEEQGAAIVLKQENISQLPQILNKLLFSPYLQAMKLNSVQMGNPKSAQKIVNFLLQYADNTPKKQNSIAA